MIGTRHNREIIRLHTVGSTMDEVARLAAAGAPEGTVVVAREQTAGRGRDGRPWRTPAGSALLCSILLRPPFEPDRFGGLPLLLGVAVAETIERVTGLPCRLKWPNDVWLGDTSPGRKVAGILLTTRSGTDGGRAVVAGIGLNVTTPSTALPPGATSLAVETGRTFSLDETLHGLLAAVDTQYRAYLDAAGSPSLDGWRARAALVDEPVSIEVAGQRRTGVLRGVDDDGALLLETDDGTVERIVSGELVRGPVREVRDSDGR